MDWKKDIKAMTFDLFGTVMDIRGSTLPATRSYLERKNSSLAAEDFWSVFRVRQRLEQYQDNILQLGHTGYRQAVRRAFIHTSRLLVTEPSEEEVKEYLKAWDGLQPFPEVMEGLERLKGKFRLVVLSNGEPEFLQHLVTNNVKWDFDGIISVQTAGEFKPSPAVYRKAAKILGLEAGECLMVSSNSFDIVGARACSFRAAFVNRNNQPLEVSSYLPDIQVTNFTELADELLA
jgi:2-haloacid dehalogenase